MYQYTWSMSRTVKTYSVNFYCCIYIKAYSILNNNLLIFTNELQQQILNDFYHILILALNMSKLHHWWLILALNVCSIKFALKHNNFEFLTQDIMSNECIQEEVTNITVWSLRNPFLILILYSSFYYFLFTLLCNRIYFVYLCIFSCMFCHFMF